MGGEALRVLLEHPGFQVAWATSRERGDAARVHPNLLGAGVELVHPDAVGPCDFVLLAVPTAESLSQARRFIDAGARVVDLGAAFRLRDRATWERAYGCSHSEWELAHAAQYGIPELRADAIAQARLVANPGCFPSAVILGLAPLLAGGGFAKGPLVVDGISGTAGVGAELWRGAHHPEIGNNLVPYNAVGHRHIFEMEQELSLVAGRAVTVHFTPVYAPITRGILAICHLFPEEECDREALLERYRAFYAEAPFVKVHDLPPESEGPYSCRAYPWVSAVAGTNFCTIGLDVDRERGRVVVFSVLDSVGKGGAQVGIENLNLMAGLERSAGLARRGLHP